jgi:hypothetical protein
MKFRYVGDAYTEWFGFKWMTGTEHDVTDPHAIGKLSNSVLFEKVGVDASDLTLKDANLGTVTVRKPRPKAEKPAPPSDE